MEREHFDSEHETFRGEVRDYEQVQNIPRAGRLEQDVAELTFHDVRVPAGNLIGAEGAAFGYLLQNLVKERLQVAVSAVAACR
jgi:acyl-CoA dehydrogenase